MKKISILIPCYNEEQSLPFLYEELKKVIDYEINYEWEILFINDGSTDKTLDFIKTIRKTDTRVCFICLSRNFGKENAMLAGFDYLTGDCCIIIDADLQDPPTLIPEMLDYWEQGFDDIYAKRSNRGNESFVKRQMSVLFYKILHRMSHIEIPQNVGDFRLLDKSCINSLRKLRESDRYTKGLYFWIGYNKKEIIFERQNRKAGTSKWNYGSLLRLAIEGFTSFSIAPLRISTYLGVIVSITSFLYMIFVLIRTLLIGDPVQGYPSMMIIILFLGGVQLLSIGIIGEYLGRIFNETKRRPPYIANNYNGEKIED